MDIRYLIFRIRVRLTNVSLFIRCRWKDLLSLFGK